MFENYHAAVRHAVAQDQIERDFAVPALIRRIAENYIEFLVAQEPQCTAEFRADGVRVYSYLIEIERDVGRIRIDKNARTRAARQSFYAQAARAAKQIEHARVLYEPAAFQNGKKTALYHIRRGAHFAVRRPQISAFVFTRDHTHIT